MIHHSPENRKSLPMRISVPSDGCVGGTPTPRNDSVASVRIAVATWIVASTSTGPMTLGSTCFRMMRSGATPTTRAACTYSLLRSTSVEPRTVRAYCTQPGKRDREHEHRKGQRVVRVGKHRAADAVDQQRDQDRRERQHDVADAHDEGIDLAADKARQQAEADADDHRQHDRRQADEHRDARAVHDGREDVAALVVGAEQVLGRAALFPGIGGRRASDSSSVARSNGLCGATHGANSALKMHTAATTAAPIAIGEVRKLCQTSPSKKRPSAVVVMDRS